MRRISILIVVLLIGACKHEPASLSPLIVENNDDSNTNNNGNGNNNNNGGVINNCDTNVVYFSQDILPILISNCTNNTSNPNGGGCHDVASHKEGIILTSYNYVMTTAHVVPYNLNGGNLIESITTHDIGDRMPPAPAAALSPSQIALIEKWIMQGAQDLTCNNGACDSTNVSYTGKVWPIINNNCKGCHSGTSPGGNILLIDYNTVAASANSGKLKGSILHNYGFSPMPKNAAMLSSCEIAVISNWIAEGVKNN